MHDAAERIVESLRNRNVHRRDISSELVKSEVESYGERVLAGRMQGSVDHAVTAERVMAALTGYGVFQPYLDDPSIEELWINSPTDIFVARNGVSERLSLAVTDDVVRQTVERMLAHSGRRVDMSQPFVDASLPDGSRLHVVIPDITPQHWSVNIRKFHRNLHRLDSLTGTGTLSVAAAEFLHAAIRVGENIIVSGPTHAGKTTLLNALLHATRPDCRIVTLEETCELSCPPGDHVSLQCRAPNLEGVGEVTLRRLVKEALRMRPDRIVVGEVREAESLDLLLALNSGIPGCATIHANSARDALLKLCTLPLLAGRNVDSQFIVPTVASSVHLVVHCGFDASGRRVVTEIIAPTGSHRDGTVLADTVFARDQRGANGLSYTGTNSRQLAKFAAAGIDTESLLRAA